MEYRKGELYGIEPARLVLSRRVISSLHRRSSKQGVQRSLQTLRFYLSNEEFNRRKATLASPIAEFEAAVGEYQRSLDELAGVFFLVDSDCAVLTTCAARGMALFFRALGIRPGVCMSEQYCGTNAVALALHHNRVVTLAERQHYCAIFHRCWCIGAPIAYHTSTVSLCVSLLTLGSKMPCTKVLLTSAIVRTLVKSWSADAASFAGKPAVTPVALTGRQHAVLSLFSCGQSYKQIAKRLGVSSSKTIEEHIDAVRRKLSTSSRRECIKKAIELGLLDTKSNEKS